MEHNRKAVEKSPDFIAFFQVEMSACLGGNYRAKLGHLRDPENAFGIDFALGDPFNDPFDPVFGAAFRDPVTALQENPRGFHLGAYEFPFAETEPFQGVVGDHGGDGKPVEGDHFHKGLDVAFAKVLNLSEKGVAGAGFSGRLLFHEAF